MAKAAIVVGAHGIMVEVHPNPDKALCDGAQSLDGDDFSALVAELNRLQTFLASA
jgi:3-deoxy-7-phosphoheptulonate synthase